MYEVFSTFKKDGKIMMSYADFLITMTPYNQKSLIDHKEIEEYLKEKTPRILKFADTDGDGCISFTEFFFFLSIFQMTPG